MKKFGILIAAFAFLLTSCGTYTLKQSDVLNNADMSSYKTFMISKADNSQLPGTLMPEDAANIGKAVAQQLIDRGYKQVSTNPDMIVYLALSVEQVIETKDALPPGGGFGYRYFGPRAAYVHSYYDDAQIISGVSTQGLLMMDIVDAKRNIHVFCSEISALADGDGEKVKDLNELKKATDVLFSKFPIPAKTK